MCVCLLAPSRGQPLCFSLWINNSATLGKTKTFQLKIPWFNDTKLFRKITVQLIRLRIGHATKPVHMHRIGLRDTPFVLVICPRLGISVTSTWDLQTSSRNRKVLLNHSRKGEPHYKHVNSSWLFNPQ